MEKQHYFLITSAAPGDETETGLVKLTNPEKGVLRMFLIQSREELKIIPESICIEDHPNEITGFVGFFEEVRGDEIKSWSIRYLGEINEEFGIVML
jgi:hypothetical protein